jgi:phosphoserine aminotransferase
MINFNSGFNSISETTKDLIIDSINKDRIFEIGHRSNEFKNIVLDLKEKFRSFLNVPKNYHILFFQGGSSLQFHIINNFGRGAYITTGYWSNKAFKDYSKNGVEIWNKEEVPDVKDLTIPENVDFIHYCSNETISGLQFPEYQKFNKPTIVDCSSDLLTRDINWNNVDMVYAHSQKNVGTVGVTVVIIKDELMQLETDNVPDILSYKTNFQHNSIYNTAPVFNINVTLIAMKELINEYENSKKIEKIYTDFSKRIYNEIDNSPLFYNNIKNRSKSTITFFIKNESELSQEEIENYFKKCNMTGFNGHRSVGGYRLSITPALLNDSTYNAIVKSLSITNDYRKTNS